MPRRKPKRRNVRKSTKDTRYKKKTTIQKLPNLLLPRTIKQPIRIAKRKLITPKINATIYPSKRGKSLKPGISARATQAVKTTGKLITPRIIKTTIRRLGKCEKVENADKARRNNFFKSKGRGNASRRPEHNRKHRRNC